MSPRAWTFAGIALAVIAVGIRANNAVRYPVGMGFDAEANWEYIEGLASSWSLSEPEAGFSTGHPPLFYYAAAGLRQLVGNPGMEATVILVRLVSAALGLLSIGLCVALVRRSDPESPRRAWLAGALLAFLPAHLTMSAMLSEEILASSLASLAVVALCFHLLPARRGESSSWTAVGVGLFAGLALLTKLSGILVLAVVVAAYVLTGWRHRQLRDGVRNAALAGCVGLVVGGWFYANNWLRWIHVDLEW